MKNTGTVAGTLESTNQKLVDSQGRTYDSTHEFGALPAAEKVFLENVNPGNTVSNAPILFDVPKDAVIDHIELHDSVLSGGVKVSLK